MIGEMTRERWDALTRDEQIEEIITAWAMSPDILQAKIPPWAPALLVHQAMQIGLARFRAEIEAAK